MKKDLDKLISTMLQSKELNQYEKEILKFKMPLIPIDYRNKETFNNYLKNSS